jgi:hypothetical protein
MQLRSSQVLRVLTHFPLPDLKIEHCYVRGSSIRRQRKRKIGSKFDTLWAMRSYGGGADITSALDDDKWSAWHHCPLNRKMDVPHNLYGRRREQNTFRRCWSRTTNPLSSGNSAVRPIMLFHRTMVQAVALFSFSRIPHRDNWGFVYKVWGHYTITY